MKLNKETLILEISNVMGIMKINPIKDFDKEDILFVESIGNYRKIARDKLKIKVVEFDYLNEIMVYYTDKTEINVSYIDKAKEICRVMGWDWDFDVYENEQPDKPLIFINSDDIAFIIAPRDRNWEKGKQVRDAFTFLDDTTDRGVKK